MGIDRYQILIAFGALVTMYGLVAHGGWSSFYIMVIGAAIFYLGIFLNMRNKKRR